jgi:hypothetical protein
MARFLFDCDANNSKIARVVKRSTAPANRPPLAPNRHRLVNQSAQGRFGFDLDCGSSEPQFQCCCGIGYCIYIIQQTRILELTHYLCRYNISMTGQRGRPLRDPIAGSSKIVPIRMTNAEKKMFVRAAKRAKVTLSEWIRNRLTKAAKRESRND